MKKFKSSYNSEDDVLYIYEPKKKSKESIELEEDLVIDIDKNKNLVALQIFYANEFFKALDKDFQLVCPLPRKPIEISFAAAFMRLAA